MSISEKVVQLKNIYADQENKISSFKEKTHLSCVFGCGDCCIRFEPYISVLEGLVIAQYLRTDCVKMNEFWNVPRSKQEILCPFYQFSNPYHCGIYGIRPSICRLYSFALKRSRHGSQYIPCPKVKSHFPQEIDLAHVLLQDSCMLPIYQEEYEKMCTVDFVLATDLHPLTRSVEIALHCYEEIDTGQYHQKELDKTTQSMLVPFSRFIRHYLRKQCSL